jgi:hypothetical protein
VKLFWNFCCLITRLIAQSATKVANAICKMKRSPSDLTVAVLY